MTLRDLRLASGLTLFVYVATHMATHASGLHSVALAERMLRASVALWHSPPGIGQLGVRLTREFGIAIGLRICVDAGHAVIGEIGHGATRALVAVGAAVDAARRLRTDPTARPGILLVADSVRQAAGPGQAALE